MVFIYGKFDVFLYIKAAEKINDFKLYKAL